MKGEFLGRASRAAHHLETVISLAVFLVTLLGAMCSGDTKLPVMSLDMLSCSCLSAFA